MPQDRLGPEPPGRVIATPCAVPMLWPADLRRRRAASRRCPPLQDGRRDPLDPEPVREPVSEAQLDCWLDTLRHLRCAGLAATLPAHVGALPVEGDPEVEQRTGECVIGGALAYEPHPRNRIRTTLKANTCFKEARAMRCLRLECAPDLRYAIGIVHSPFSSGSTRAALVVLGVDPRSQVVQAVDDAATEAKAGRARPEVAPVAQGGDRRANEFCRLGDGEQVKIANAGAAAGRCGVVHGSPRCSSAVADLSPGRASC